MSNPFIVPPQSPATSTTVDQGDHRKSQKRIREGSEQQRALWASLLDENQHILCEARAGSGKSSSSREGMHRILERSPDASIQYAVFNNQNALEFAAEAPDGVRVGTVHAFGRVALAKTFRSMLEKNKTYALLDENADTKKAPRWLRRSIAQTVAAAKGQGLHPDAPHAVETMRYLLHRFDINPYGREEQIVGHAVDVLRRSLEWVELIDFDDMIYLPAHLDASFPQADYLFLDEVQDWSPCQHMLIPKMAASGRVIAVGDRYQSIYGFRGADIDSIPRLASHLAATREGRRDLPLTVTWRCPASHVDLARRFVPDIEPAPAAIDGEIEHVSHGDYAPGDMVLCYANAPIVSEALRLVASGRRAIVRGRKIGDSLLDILRTIPDQRTIAGVTAGIERWLAKELLRFSELENADDLVEEAKDRAAGLSAIAAGCETPTEIPAAIDRLFSDAANPASMPGAVVFSTIHRAKGLEAEHVHLIAVPMRKPKRDWEAQQQRNLEYVALTRSKRRLVFVDPSSIDE